MKERCYVTTQISYPNYGGKGIKVCDKWQEFIPFMEWAYANGYDETAPRGQYTLERRDTNGPYSPENCCWITIKEQERNKSTTIYVDDDGERITLAEYCDRHGTNYKTAQYQLCAETRESVKGRIEKKRRTQGMRPREEYNRERAEKSAAKLEQLKQTMTEHPGLSNRELAKAIGISESGVRKLKKKLNEE